MLGADIGICDILINDASLGALIGGTKTNARCNVGNLPQGQVFPACTVEMNNSDPQNVKGAAAPADYAEIYVYTYGVNLPDARIVANAVRSAIDGKKDIVTVNNVNIGLVWFADEQYFTDKIENNILHHYEQRYFVRVKNN